MIKKIFLVGILLSGSSLPQVAQTAGVVKMMTIADLFDNVESGSSSLRVKQTGVEIAQKDVELAKNRRLPDIDASLSFSYIGNALMTDRNFSNAKGLKSPHYGNSFALQAQQVVYSGGAVTAGIKLAEMDKQQAEIDVKQVRQQSRFVALGQYLDLFRLDNRRKVYEKNIKLTQRLIEDIKEKQNQGMALKNDVTRYELQLQTLQLGLTSLNNNRDILNYQLCNTLEISTETTIVPDTSLTENVKRDEAGVKNWQQRSVASSPLLERSALNVDMARQKEKIAKSELLPKVALVAANNFDGPITFELPPIDKNLNVWYVGVGVKYNLSALYKNKKSVRQSVIATRQAQEALGLQEEQVENQMQAAYVQYRQTFVELDTQCKSVELARQNYDVVNARYLSQLALVTDMVDASNILLNAELQEVDARINIVYAYYRMKYVAGEI